MDHPAKFSSEIIDRISYLLNEVWFPPNLRVLDPFAGTGRIHQLQEIGYQTVGVEIEPEWAGMHPQTIVGSALTLPFRAGQFGAIVTSPCYGNRMADRYKGDAKGSKRHTYRVALGREVNARSSAQLQWGQAYRDFHVQAWSEAKRVLVLGGLFVLNISDHVRKGEIQPVSAWHVHTLAEKGGMEWLDAIPVQTKRMTHGKNANKRVAVEWIHVLRKVRFR